MTSVEDVTEPVVDILIGDELRAGNTISNFLTGKPVSAGDAVHAAVTVGSDLLYLVPGIGWAVKGAQMASRAAKAGKAASAGKKAIDAQRVATSYSMKATNAKYAAINAKNRRDFLKNTKDAMQYQYASKSAAKVSAKASKKFAAVERAIGKSKGMKTHKNSENRDAWEAYAADAAAFARKAASFKKKRNSPKRRAMRKIGRVGSAAQNTASAYKYISDNYYGSDE